MKKNKIVLSIFLLIFVSGNSFGSKKIEKLSQKIKGGDITSYAKGVKVIRGKKWDKLNVQDKLELSRSVLEFQIHELKKGNSRVIGDAKKLIEEEVWNDFENELKRNLLVSLALTKTSEAISTVIKELKYADKNKRKEDFYNALHALCFTEDEEVGKLLIKKLNEEKYWKLVLNAAQETQFYEWNFDRLMGLFSFMEGSEVLKFNYFEEEEFVSRIRSDLEKENPSLLIKFNKNYEVFSRLREVANYEKREEKYFESIRNDSSRYRHSQDEYRRLIDWYKKNNKEKMVVLRKKRINLEKELLAKIGKKHFSENYAESIYGDLAKYALTNTLKAKAREGVRKAKVKRRERKKRPDGYDLALEIYWSSLRTYYGINPGKEERKKLDTKTFQYTGFSVLWKVEKKKKKGLYAIHITQSYNRRGLVGDSHGLVYVDVLTGSWERRGIDIED